MPTTTTNQTSSTRLFDLDPGTQQLIQGQSGLVDTQTQGIQNLGNFLDFQIGSGATPDASLSNSTFDFGGGANQGLLTNLQNQTAGSFGGGQNQALLNQLTQGTFDSFNSGLPQAEQDIIDQIFQPQFDLGQEELLRFADELAGRGGLNLSDSPVADPATRAASDLFSRLGIGSAQASLGQLNLGRDRLDRLRGQELGQGNIENQRLDQLRSFQEGLRQQGFQNRLGQENFAETLQQNALRNRIGLLGTQLPGEGLSSRLLALNSLNRDVTNSTQTESPDANILDIIGALGPTAIDLFSGQGLLGNQQSVAGGLFDGAADIGSSLLDFLSGLGQ